MNKIAALLGLFGIAPMALGTTVLCIAVAWAIGDSTDIPVVLK